MHAQDTVVVFLRFSFLLCSNLLPFAWPDINTTQIMMLRRSTRSLVDSDIRGVLLAAAPNAAVVPNAQAQPVPPPAPAANADDADDEDAELAQEEAEEQAAEEAAEAKPPKDNTGGVLVPEEVS